MQIKIPLNFLCEFYPTFLNKKKKTFTLRLVEALAEAGIRIVDIECGQWHTIVLTDEVSYEEQWRNQGEGN